MNDDGVLTERTKPPWGPARVTRWAGSLGVILPAITLAVYPIWSYPGTQTTGTDVRYGLPPTTIAWS